MTLKTLKRSVFLFCLQLSLISVGCGEADKRKAVYISESYYGWIRIEYGVKGAAPLPSISFFRRHYPYFSDSGLLQTSSELKRDVDSVEIYYGTAMEVRPVPAHMIHGRISSLSVIRPDGAPSEREFETAFIGSADEYEKYRHELERFQRSNDKYVIPEFADLPKVGNIRH
jgi:hypothetical protein